ncbi:proteasomal ubiquitin receptor ADRM1 homolog [Drosophila albomicans]|uniref:Proteasomal ubiquitin receptor ADRM1 homolog n=1 Tax=Drosophila albomicans TaxID=7291 RepID=A0A6P8XRC9_DROAB|nr:proteasomal ubiquitin receptor ADRM1 homolog [Drosophila albomicans]
MKSFNKIQISSSISISIVFLLSHTHISFDLFKLDSDSADADRHLVEFKAGRMIQGAQMVEPDNRKGLIYLYRDEAYDLHFCWMDRRRMAVEIDIIVSPGTLEFHRVESCKTGRIYVLKFRRSPNRLFFWMQDPRFEHDAEICAQVNELLRSNTNSDDDYSLKSVKGANLKQSES